MEFIPYNLWGAYSGQILCDLGVSLNRPVSMGRLCDDSLSFVNALSVVY